MKSSVRNNGQTEDQSSIWDKVNEWNQMFVIAKWKIRPKFNLVQGEYMKASIRNNKAEDQILIWDRVNEWNQVFVKTK